MHLDLQGEDPPGFDVLRLAGRLAVGSVEARARNQGDGAVGRDVGEADEPVRPGGVGGHPEHGLGQPEDLGGLGKGLAVVDQAEGVGAALVVGHVAPPHDGAAGLEADAGHAAQLVGGLFGGHT